MLTRIRQVSIEQEASAGTPETLVAADVQFETEESDATFGNEKNERNPQRSSLSRVPKVAGARSGGHTGKVEVVGGGASNVKPPIVDLLLASAHEELVVNKIELTGAPTGTYKHGEKITSGAKVGRFLKMLDSDTMLYAVVSGTFAAADTITGSKSGASSTVHGTPGITAMGYAYKPLNPESAPTFTMGTNKDGVLYSTHGSRASGQLGIDGAAKLAYFNYDVMGAATKPVDAALFTGVTLPTVLPESFVSAGLKAGGDELCVDGFNLDLGITKALRRCANAAGGIQMCRITDRKPTIAIAPYASLEATKDFWNEYDTCASFDFFAQVGSTAGTRFLIAAPNAQWGSIAGGDREGEQTYEAPLDLNGSESTGDDEYIIAFF